MQLEEENFNSQNCTGKNNEAYNKTIKITTELCKCKTRIYHLKIHFQSLNIPKT